MNSLSQISRSCLIYTTLFTFLLYWMHLSNKRPTNLPRMTALKSFSRTKLAVLHGSGTTWFQMLLQSIIILHYKFAKIFLCLQDILISLSVKLMFSRNLSIIFNKRFSLVLSCDLGGNQGVNSEK